ncbi:MAG: bifunctional diaminohydroxyphosphoribosylaminopyrimidine deaminase/5-amino-6-(5-phosphoribosylamino)uracil reductase RibD, partial [Candidatus Cloacimonadota bacterium]|nr:bifunctional diaminohydroxyphosphoribosylaminopyrimidine deaminase/5-amino-6-(5-phosphoribosylamino)uracil reductase RibD [Candidatus Cloacimonadota bacterium]
RLIKTFLPEERGFFMEKFMAEAIRLAKKYRGRTSPNPMVGAIVVKEGIIVGRGAHKRAGLAHAEVEALNQAGKKAEGATLYVNLEPCSHFGKTPPCTDLIIRSKISHVVTAIEDPNPLVGGKGHSILQKNGIKVTTGILKKEAEKLNEIFLKNMRTKQPFAILKSAITLDGKIATKVGSSKWITNSKSRERVHRIRSEVDAILVGKNTLMIDNPRLNVRLKNIEKNPFKIVISNSFNFDKIIKTNVYKLSSKEQLILCTTENKIDQRFINDNRIVIVQFDNIQNLMKQLYSIGICSILVEGGQSTYTSFLKNKLADKIHLFVSNKMIGNEGLGWIGNMAISEIENAIKLVDIEFEQIDNNMLITGYLR